jgi:hypothetical protein
MLARQHVAGTELGAAIVSTARIAEFVASARAPTAH